MKPVESDKELKAVHDIRKIVFVKEQGVSERIEIDEHETDSTHIIATMDDKPVGTARWRRTDIGIKLERFAVLKEYRGYAVGKKLVEFCINAHVDSHTVYLNAQTSVIEFYTKYGFQTTGPEFMEADIPHVKMVYKK